MNLNENEDQPNVVNDQQTVEVVNENTFSSLDDDRDKDLNDTPEKTQNQP